MKRRKKARERATEGARRSAGEPHRRDVPLSGAGPMWLALSLVIVVSFLLYVLCFGASSSGAIGQLNHFLTASVGGCIRGVLGKCFGKRCFTAMEKVEDYCCWRPNPFLQLFYLALMAGGFALYWMHSCPLMPNPRLPLAHKIASVWHP